MFEKGESSKGRKCPRGSGRSAGLTPEQKRQARRERDKKRRQSLTPEAREEINARRRAHTESLTLEERQAANACRRVARKNLPIEERQEANARRRVARKNISPEARQALLDHRKASYAARRDTPCTESITMRCPEPCALQVDHPSSSTPTFRVRNDDDMESLLNGIRGMDTIHEDDMDEEYYIFSGEGGNVSEDVNFNEEVDDFVEGSNAPDPYDIVYSNIPKNTHSLKPVASCKHCGAKRFQYESKGFCCRLGKIKLANVAPIPELMRLWSSEDSDARHFRESIRFFNGHFSFTTLGVSLDNNYTNMRSGVYTFRAHGQMYHNVHSFGPRDSGPDHLQLYFYDDDPTLQHRFRHSPSLDQEVITKLVNILRDNPYSQIFRSLGQTEDLAEYRISLNTDQRLDQRRYNVPLSSEVAAVWVEGNDLVRKFKRSVILYGNDNTKSGIQPY